jgi:hypothetical protein
MKARRRRASRNLLFEPLEGRALMSTTGVEPPHARAGAVILARRHVPKITDASPGQTAVLNAIFGGAGHEFVTLAQKEVHNIAGVASEFESGALKQFTAPGMVFKIANWQTGYTGFPHDPQSLTVAGAILLKRRKIELAAIVRGPFTTYPGTTYVVFALDRGAGARLGPAFADRPGITPDALVTVTVGPDALNNSATVTDLTTGMTQPLNPDIIQVKGPVVRLLISASQLPSKGFALRNYKFAVYNQLVPNGDYSQTGSFVPETSMIPIGVLTNVAPPRL